MTILRLTSKSRAQDTDTALELATAGSGDQDLLLGRTKKDWGAGGEVSVMQYVSTWSRHNPDACLRLYCQSGNSAYTFLDGLTQRPLGIFALVTAARIHDHSGQVDLSAQAYQAVRQRLDEHEARPLERRGPRIFFVCADGSSRWAIRPLYGPSEQVRTKTEFRTLADSAFAEILARSKLARLSLAPQVGDIVYELFRNTHDWARHDWDGRRIRRGARALMFELYHGSQIQHAVPATNDVISAYLNRSRSQAWGRSGVLELSLIDTGPGLAQRWLGRSIKEISRAEERDACIQCLRKHKSTALRSHAGVGLFEVLEAASVLGALIQVRTGRLLLYRDFSQQTFAPQDPSEPNLSVIGVSQERTLPFAVGTSITLIIPFPGPGTVR